MSDTERKGERLLRWADRIKKKKKKKREAFLNAANQSGGAWPSLPHQPTVIQMC